MTSPLQITKRIDKLHLVEGDIIVVRDIELLKVLCQMEMPAGAPRCPVIFAPDGIEKLSRQALQEMLASSDVLKDEPEPNLIEEPS